MSTKLKDFIHRFTAEHSKGRLPVDVSSNGTSTVLSSKALEDVLFRRFDEMRPAAHPLAGNSKSD